FLRTPDVLRGIVDRLWQHILGDEMTKTEIKKAVTICESLPLGDEGCCEHVDDALDAVGAVILTLNACQQHNVDNVVRAAEVVRDAIDRPLWKKLAEQFGGVIGRDEHRAIQTAISSHPTMVAAIEKEEAQLRLLFETEELSEKTVAQLLT